MRITPKSKQSTNRCLQLIYYQVTRYMVYWQGNMVPTRLNDVILAYLIIDYFLPIAYYGYFHISSTPHRLCKCNVIVSTLTLTVHSQYTYSYHLPTLADTYAWVPTAGSDTDLQLGEIVDATKACIAATISWHSGASNRTYQLTGSFEVNALNMNDERFKLESIGAWHCCCERFYLECITDRAWKSQTKQ